MSIKIGDTHKLVIGKDGKPRLVANTKAILKSLPVNKRIAARAKSANKVRFAGNSRKKSG